MTSVSHPKTQNRRLSRLGQQHYLFGASGASPDVSDERYEEAHQPRLPIHSGSELMVPLACLFHTNMSSHHSAVQRPTVWRRIHNAIELVPLPVRRNHIRVRKGLGQVHHSPPKKRSQAHHAIAVMCPLKTARRKALHDRFN